jgi:hypothetical protein
MWRYSAVTARSRRAACIDVTRWALELALTHFAALFSLGGEGAAAEPAHH